MRVAICLFFLFVCAANNVFADLLTFNLTTDKSTYNLNETVTWQTTLTLSEVVGGSTDENFGIHTVSFDLDEDQDLLLDPSNTIISPQFFDYFFTNQGVNTDFEDNLLPGKLLNVGATSSFFDPYDASIVEVTKLNPGPTLFATGSFTAAVLGTHNLTLTPDASQYYAIASGTVGTNYDSLVGSSKSFNVVPEPSTMLLSLLGAATTLGYSLRRRAKAKKAKSRSVDASDSTQAN